MQKPSQLSRVTGMDDLFEAELATWRHVEAVARETLQAFGFGEIRTPIVEETALFVRGVGEGTDIVHKEMFAFDDKGDKEGSTVGICLRPENTAGVVRAMLEHGKLFADAYEQVFYIGPMFRRERPQAGRRRQFHQLGCEAFGFSEAAMDVAVISAVQVLLERLGLGPHVQLLINTLGDAADRAAYSTALVAYFSAHKDKLSADSQRRLVENPLRILDSKDPGDRALITDAPKPISAIGDDARAHFDAVCHGLDRAGVAYVKDDALVRGLDYYTRTVFEFVGTAGLGAQATVAAGGRYDGLVETLGGRHTPAVGFAGGIERLVMMMTALGLGVQAPGPAIYLIGADDGGRDSVEVLAMALRREGIAVGVDVRGRSVKAQMKSADKSGARLSAVIGSGETASGTVKVKTMATGDVHETPLTAQALAALCRGASGTKETLEPVLV
jgi:histidyl-tRNA synthetase